MEYFEYSFREKVNIHEYEIPNYESLLKAVESIMPENAKFELNQTIKSLEKKGNKDATIEMGISIKLEKKYHVESSEIKNSLEKVLGHELTEKTI